jgi:DNA gyrase subunit B
MPELIERGHVYIAQPPLYKVKKGKTERYLSNEAQRDLYLMELALEEAQLIPGENKTPIKGEELNKLADAYIASRLALQSLVKRYRVEVISVMQFLPALSHQKRKDRAHVENWFASLVGRIQSQYGMQCTTEVFVTAKGDEYGGRITMWVHGVEITNVFSPEFFASREYQDLTRLLETGELGDSARMERADQSIAIDSIKKGFDWLLDEAARGLHVQRYKGLGEMNPDQLWETTMDAKTRVLSQVMIEDSVAADEIFTTLMGDQVEPRREFIERNALLVENLDT